MLPTFKKSRSIAALCLTILACTSALPAALSCSPDYQHAVIFSWNHPDLPLRDFARGNLGVIQSNWARSYLCLAYRYLANKPLAQGEQTSAVQLFHQRIYDQGSYLFDKDYYPSLNYEDLRFKILKFKPHGEGLYSINSMADTFAITDSAFAFALETLRGLIKKYGINSPYVYDWAKAQDGVFGYNDKKQIITPKPLAQSQPQSLQSLRLYQIAASHFYQGQYKKAQAEFKALAESKDKDLATISDYLSERARVAYCLGAGAEETPAKTLERLEQKANNTDAYTLKIQYIALAGLIFSNSLTPAENATRVLEAVCKSAIAQNKDPKVSPESASLLAIRESADAFGRNLGDLTYWLGLSDGPLTKEMVEANDMASWLATIYDGYDCFYDPRYLAPEEKQKYQALHKQNAEKALEQWSRKRSLPWLVAVMLTSGLRGADKAQARAQAQTLSPASPAYLTASFYLVDALIADGQIKEATTKLHEVAQTESYIKAPPTARNFFAAQRLAGAANIDDYLKAAALKISAASSNHLLVPDKWPKPSQLDGYKAPDMDALDVEVAKDIDGGLPYASWLAWSKDKKMAANLHGRIVCATWIRAILLQKNRDIGFLTSEMARCFPSCSGKLAAFNQAQGSARHLERDYLFAQNCLDNFGFSPYVQAGLPRMGDNFNTFNYYQHNYWQALPAVAPSKNSKDPNLQKTEIDQEIEIDDNYQYVADRANADLAPVLQGYYEQHQLAALLTSEQRAQAASERRKISALFCARVLSGAVVAFAQAHSVDQAELAEADKEHSLAHYLYKAVKLPYWSGQSPQATRYSRAAYVQLHSKFPKSKWAKRLSFWY